MLVWVGVAVLVLQQVYSSRRDKLSAIEQKVAANQSAAEVATANERAAAAERKADEAQQFQAQRRLTAEQRAALVSTLKVFAGQNARIVMTMGDDDGLNYGNEFRAVLNDAGWVVPDADMRAGFNPSGPVGLQVSFSIEQRTDPPPAAIALAKSLTELGLIAATPEGGIQLHVTELPTDMVQLRVGSKARP